MDFGILITRWENDLFDCVLFGVSKKNYSI